MQSKWHADFTDILTRILTDFNRSQNPTQKDSVGIFLLCCLDSSFYRKSTLCRGFFWNFIFTKDITCLAPIEAIRRAVRKAGKTFTTMRKPFASKKTASKRKRFLVGYRVEDLLFF